MRTKNKRNLLYLSLVIWLISSCTGTSTPASPPPTQPPPTPRPTTILNSATDFTEGMCDVPEGYYLFLKYTSHMACSKACDCPAIEPPDSAIDRHKGNIYYKSERVNGTFKPWDSEDTALGLVVYGWFEETLYAIESMPFEVPGSRKPFLGCDSTGMVIIEIGGEAYELEPGGGWSSQSVHDRGEGCYETHTISIGNSGLYVKQNHTAFSNWNNPLV